MKKSAKPAIIFFFVLALCLVFLLFGVVWLRLKTDSMKKEKVQRTALLEAAENENKQLTAQSQSFLSEEFIVPSAEKIKMIRNDEILFSIQIDEAKVDSLTKFLAGENEYF